MKITIDIPESNGKVGIKMDKAIPPIEVLRIFNDISHNLIMAIRQATVESVKGSKIFMPNKDIMKSK